MKRLVLIAIFTLCLSGVAYAQDPAGPSTAPPTIGGGDSEIHVKVSRNTDGEVRVGNVRVTEGKQASETGRGPSREPGANGGGKGPKETGPRETGPKDRGGPKDKGPKETGPRDSGPRGGRRDNM